MILFKRKIGNMRINSQSNFLKSILILSSGSILAQIIAFLASPFITRLFSPEELGEYTYILSISTLFIPIINGRYDVAIVTENDERNVFSLIKLSFIISITIAFVISVLALFKCSDKYDLFIVFGLFLLLIICGLMNILISYNNRNKDYKLMSNLYILRSIYQNIGAIILGIFNWGIFGLFYSYILGQFVGISKQSKKLKPYINDIRKISIKELCIIGKKYYRQPLFSAPAIFINSYSFSSITFFIEILYGMSSVGFYSISTRILGLPLSIISGNISKVFFEQASREFDQTGQFNNTFKKTTVFLVVLALPMLFLMNFIIPKLIVLFFGSEWEEAGEYIKVLAFMYSIRFVVSSITPGMLVSNKQKYEFFIQSGFVLVSIICYIMAKSIELTIIEYLSLVNTCFAIMYIIYYIIIYKFSKNRRD